MAKREIPKDMIPVNSAEAYVIQMKLLEKALSIFEKHNVNMPLGYQGKLEVVSRWQS